MKNIRTLFCFQLKTNLKSIAIWSAVLFGIMAMYMAFFSTMQEMARVKFERLPKEYLQLVGIEDLSEMSNYVSFFGMIFHILIIVLSLYAVTFSIHAITKEEQTKTIEYLYSLPVTRNEIYISKVCVTLCSVVIILLSTSLSGILFGFLVGDHTFQLADMFAIIKITGTIPFFFAAFGLFLASFSPKHAGTGLGCGFVMLTYMLGYLSEILEDKAEFLQYCSPFTLLSPANAVSLSKETAISFGILAVLIIVLLILSSFLYRRRDYSL